MTIGDLLHSQPTVSQYDMLARADRSWFPAGRYYGGQLELFEVRYLTDGVELRKSTREQIDKMYADELASSTGIQHPVGLVDAVLDAPIPFETLTLSSRDAEWLEQQPGPVGPECFRGEDFPSEPSDDTMAAVDAVLQRHSCTGCGLPCDCGRTPSDCAECESCSIPF